MNKTTRQTRSCALGELNPLLLTAIRAHIAKYQLGELENSILMCCETSAIRHKGGIFPSVENSISGIFITPQWLVWAEKINGKTQAGSAQLRQIDARDYEETAMFSVSPDQGVNIAGRYTNTNQTGQVFIGLGKDSAGEAFRQLLHETLRAGTPTE